MTESGDNRAIQWAKEQVASVDTQRAPTLPMLYVSPDTPPHQALKLVREFAFRVTGPEDKSLALIVVALDRILDQLAGYRARVVYEREAAKG